MEACTVAPTSLFTIFVIIVSVFIAFFNAEKKIPGIYFFGDSLMDVGNNNYLYKAYAGANFPHNGINFPTKIPTGRFCNGKNVADFLAERLKLLSPLPYLSLKFNKNKVAFIAGVSFASDGARIFNEILV